MLYDFSYVIDLIWNMVVEIYEVHKGTHLIFPYMCIGLLLITHFHTGLPLKTMFYHEWAPNISMENE